MKVLASPYLESVEHNPIQQLLYSSMERLGVEVASFSGRRLLAESWDVWHLHWPESIVYAPTTLDILVQMLKFWAKLKLARAKKTKIFWTVHNLRPHERESPVLERIFWRLFLPNIDGVICMSESGRRLLCNQHPRASAHPIFVIPHGHYRGAYPDTITKNEARRTLGIGLHEIALTFIGQIRPYKGIPDLIRCFGKANIQNARLVIAGKPRNDSIAQELEGLAGANSSVQLFLNFVANRHIQDFLRATDLVVLPYTEILNSGSAILALSFNRPVLVPAKGAMVELHEAVGPEWVRLFEGDLTPEVIREAVQWAIGRQSRSESLAPLEALEWDRIAKVTIDAFSH